MVPAPAEPPRAAGAGPIAPLATMEATVEDFEARTHISPSLDRIYEFGLRHRLTSAQVTGVIKGVARPIDRMAMRLDAPRLSSVTWRIVRDRILTWYMDVDYVSMTTFADQTGGHMLSQLNLLRDGYDSTADMLRARGVTGERSNGCWCPLANLFREMFDATQVYVGMNYSIVDGVTVMHASWVRQFIDAFDHANPELSDLYAPKSPRVLYGLG